MRAMRAAIVVAILAIMVFAIVPSEESDGNTTVTDGSTWYCYGDNPTFVFPEYSEGIEVSWEVIDGEGNDVTPEDQRSDSQITVNLAGYDCITVTQTVSAPNGEPSTMTIHVIPLHIPAGASYTVRFHDAGNLVGTYVITNNTVVEAGQPHVIDPAIERDGYEFRGWFEEDAETQFDFTQPISGDVDLYAKWGYSGVSGGSTDNVVIGTNTVTFNTGVGLYCDPSQPGTNSVQFEVGVLGGFELHGAITVTATGGNLIQMSDGVYLLSGIEGNVTVTISGNTTPIDSDPDDDITDDDPGDVPVPTGNDYTMFAVILIVLAVICIVLALYILRTRGSRV